MKEEPLLTVGAVDRQFDLLKMHARKFETLPEAAAASAADLKAFNGLIGLYTDLRTRSVSEAELQGRGRRIRADYIAEKRAELLVQQIFRHHQEMYKRSSQLCAALCKPWKGTPAEMIEAVTAYIAALLGEATPVTATRIGQNMQAVLLNGASDSVQAEARPSKARPEKRFVPPTLEEVRAYFIEKRFKSNPDAFFAYYEGSGWVRSRGVKIKDWKAAARTWEIKETDYRPPARKKANEAVYTSDASYDLEAYRATAIGMQEEVSA